MQLLATIAVLLALAQQPPPERFDLVVREDFFAGYLANDMTRFERGMHVVDRTLAANPKHTDAMAWKASGLIFLSIRAYEAGDQAKSAELWDAALRLMDEARALAPKSVGVLATSGGTLIKFLYRLPPDRARVALDRAKGLYDDVYQVQAQALDKMGVHHRGEVYGALAEINYRLGNVEESRKYLTRIVQTMSGTPYERKAKQWLENPAAIQKNDAITCLTCHTNK